ncbi:EAL domain-containing protein [Solibacillus sp. MA9]|uniref:EAL domain-containing protein n=1 Tax=Solibacillus palustris TaxID=2908203 RepID=A0ABS9UCQ9_9BACL|nr:EAL domain-containing protein [Solibacillus sp. MA9]MCH7322131.1 EAL domain-containing protein [Solibacillus sp. MA9]
MNEFDNRSLSDAELYFWLCQMARQLDSGIVIVNTKKGYTIEFVNHVFSHMTDYNEHDMIGMTIDKLRGQLTDILNEEAIQESIENGLTFKTSSLHYRKDGSTFWNEVNIIPMHNQFGELQYSVLMMRDLTDSINVEALIELEREVYFSLENGDSFERIMNKICSTVSATFGKKCFSSIVLVDDYNRMKYVYGELTEEIHFLDEELLLVGLTFNENTSIKKPVIIKNLSESQYNKIFKPLIEKHPFVSLWSQPILNTEGKIIGLFSIYFEQQAEPLAADFKFLNRVVPIVTLAVKYYEQKNAIRQLIYQDASTGLTNFEHFKNKMMSLIEHGYEGALCIIAPGEYQNIVDLQGRQAGDEILRQLAGRLQKLTTFNDSIIARYTSSSIIVASRSTNQQVRIPQQEIDDILFEPYYINDKETYLTLKIGTASFNDNEPFIDAIRKSDIALSNALKASGTVVKRFEQSQIESVEQEMNVLAHITKGLKNNEFLPMLQPKVNIATGEIESFEALARWVSSEIGFVSPAVFIPVAENTGNIYKIDRAILRKVLQWLEERVALGLKLYQVSVNISPSHFYNAGFVENSIALIESYNIDPKYIKFEITESIELDNVMRAKKIINELKANGIDTAIDDFGVGYSSLSYLQKLPFEEIKIDKSFVDNLADPRMNAVVKTIIQLSKNLNMISVAEGIETKEQHEELKRLGCQTGQGYYYFKPLPLEEINKLLEESVPV